MENSFITDSRQLIEEARNRRTNLVITGHNSKKFYGNPNISPHMELNTIKKDFLQMKFITSKLDLFILINF